MILQLPVNVAEAPGEKGIYIQPGDKNPVTRPEGEVKQRRVIDPGQDALVGVDQLAGELLSYKEKTVPIVIVGKPRKGDQPAQYRVDHRQPALFAHFADGARFRGLPRQQLATQAVPLAGVHVIFFFDAVQHQRLAPLAHVTEGCHFDSHK